MKEEKTLEEQLRDMKISKDDPKVLKRRIEELEGKIQELEHENSYERPQRLGPNEKICPILREKTGDGRIEVVNERPTCKYSSIGAYGFFTLNKKYSTCKVTDEACPYTGLPGRSEHW